LEGLTKQSFNRTPQARAFCPPENARACGVRLIELAATNHFKVGGPLGTCCSLLQDKTLRESKGSSKMRLDLEQSNWNDERSVIACRRHLLAVQRSVFVGGVVAITVLVATWAANADQKISDAVRRPSTGSPTNATSKSVAGQRIENANDTSRATEQQQSAPAPGIVELKSSRVYVFVGKTGLGHEHAVIGTLKSGELHLGREKDAGKLEFDMRSFVADGADARQYIGLKGETDRATAQKVTNNMLGPQVLNVASFPTATFAATSIKKQRDLKEGAAEYLLEGDFTLHGVTQKIRFTALDEPKKGWHHLRGRFAIRQTDFGITPFTTALGAVGVANELTIFGDLWVCPDTPLADKPEEPAR
jgi:hypothetical protein